MPLPQSNGGCRHGRVSSAGSLLIDGRVLIPYAQQYQPPGLMILKLQDLLNAMEKV